ncbi:MAG: ATP-binding protein, partial [Thaumarchaeota archaeon]|nr:ATP-binding protein [Nitrososphaerota archaeon]
MAGLTDEQAAVLDVGVGPSGPFKIDANLVVTGRTCVLGSSGSGKSYAVGVLCEELCRHQVPFAIVDTEGEHSGLKEKFETIWVGEEQGSDLSWGNLDLS